MKNKKYKIIKFLKKIRFLKYVWHFYKKLPKLHRIKRITPAIIQLLPNFSNNDAIGNMVDEIQKSFSKEGLENFIVCEGGAYNNNPLCFNLRKFKFLKNDLIIYHMSTGCYSSKVYFKCKSANKIMIYHNITPEKYFNGKRKRIVKKGRKQLLKLKNVTNASICDSVYNAKELESIGYKNIHVIPVIHKIDNLLLQTTKIVPHNNPVFITVGRIAKNKCIIDVIKIFKEIAFLNNDAKLYIIGKIDNKQYYEDIIKFVDNNNLKDKINFVFNINSNELANFYANSDGYICMSEHEGFCVPLLEAMAFNVPVFAYNSSAIKETMGNSGIIYDNKNFELIAKNILQTLNDKTKLQQVKKTGYKRYLEFDNKINLQKYLIEINRINKTVKENYLFSLYYYAYDLFKKSDAKCSFASFSNYEKNILGVMDEK